MNKEEKIYMFNEYVLGYDEGNNDRSCLTISKVISGDIYVMGSLYDGSAKIISLMLDNLQQENKQLKDNWNKLKEYLLNKIDEYDTNLEFWSAELLSYVKNKMQELESSDNNAI